MEKYYSSVLCSSGLLCNFKFFCEKHPESKFYIIPDGTDFERECFFTCLTNMLKGYAFVRYCPFYDDTLSGIYLKSFNTYILTDSLYGRVCPIAPYICEKRIELSGGGTVTQEEKSELARLFTEEKNYYKKAVSALELAAACKENRNSLLSDYIIDGKIINAIKRIINKLPTDIKKGKPQIKFLSAVTPLGIHTLWDTVFENYETVIELEDSLGFSSAVIAGVIRDKLIASKEEFILVPDLLQRTIPQMLLFPQTGIAVVRTDGNHSIPFAPTHRINTEKFTPMPKSVKEKHNILLEAENRYLETAVSCIYEGRDARRERNKILLPRGSAENAKQTAREIFKEIVG